VQKEIFLFYTIYKITNKINGKYYIGKHQTTNIDDDYMGSGKNIKRAIAKYGIDNFTKEILRIYDNEVDMNAAEKELVIISEETYNLCEGGKGGFGYINSVGKNFYKDHDKVAISNLAKGKKALQEYYASGKHKEIMKPVIQKIHEKYPEGIWKGKKHTPETIKKLSGHNRQNGELNSQYGKPRSEETKQKIRQTLLNKKLNNQNY
jgi:hypothetical protein